MTQQEIITELKARKDDLEYMKKFQKEELHSLDCGEQDHFLAEKRDLCEYIQELENLLTEKRFS